LNYSFVPQKNKRLNDSVDLGRIVQGDESISLYGLVRFYPNPYGLRGIEGVLIPSKSKSPPIRINPLQSIWIENNRASPTWGRVREREREVLETKIGR
jgi:hypothetical protein